ncbi:hypothetical protein [Prevotella intermedia]|nr:hypothetical protein [Prevotella intermedia]MCK6144983.1 hypothetical protein [Prevotella intermedia]
MSRTGHDAAPHGFFLYCRPPCHLTPTKGTAPYTAHRNPMLPAQNTGGSK